MSQLAPRPHGAQPRPPTRAVMFDANAVAASPLGVLLGSQRVWTAWRPEHRPGAQKPTKTPITAGGRPAKVNDPQTWGTLAQARDWVSRHAPRGGLLVALTEQLGLVVVDLDGVVAGETVADPVIARFVAEARSYTELSPSGTGLHVWVRLAAPWRPARNRHGAVEVYAAGRFMSATGAPVRVDGSRLLRGESWALRTVTVEEIERLLGIVGYPWSASGAQPPAQPAPPLPATDAELVERIERSRQGEKFRRLMDGDASGYPSVSEAELALCSIIAFWTDDPAQVERIWLSSKLADREKTRERADYRQRTLDRAMQSAAASRRNGAHVNGAALLNGKHPPRDAPGGDPPREETSSARPTLPQDAVGAGVHYEHLMPVFAERFLWCSEWRSWLRWEATRWVRVPEELVRTFAYEQLLKLYSDQVARGVDRARKRLDSLVGGRHLNTALELLKGVDGILARAAEFDADPTLLGCANGVLDLKTLRLLPPEPGQRITRQVAAAYAPDAPAPLWESFIKLIFRDDAELIGYVQRAVGAALLGNSQEQVAYLLHGRGSNGKSTFLQTLLKVLGDYATPIPRALLVTGNEQDDSPRIALESLVGARVGTLEELSDSAELNIVGLKDLVSGGALAVRGLWQSYRSVRLQITPFVAFNVKPRVNEHTDGAWRRIRVIPFLVQIPEDRKDKDFGNKLLTEADGIFAWIIRGLLDYRQLGGLGTCRAVEEATREYRGEQDPLAGWITDCVVQDDTAVTPVEDLRRSYEQWAAANGVPEDERLNANRFARALTARGFGAVLLGAKRQRARRGLRLRQGEPQEESLHTLEG